VTITLKQIELGKVHKSVKFPKKLVKPENL